MWCFLVDVVVPIHSLGEKTISTVMVLRTGAQDNLSIQLVFSTASWVAVPDCCGGFKISHAGLGILPEIRGIPRFLHEQQSASGHAVTVLAHFELVERAQAMLERKGPQCRIAQYPARRAAKCGMLPSRPRSPLLVIQAEPAAGSFRTGWRMNPLRLLKAIRPPARDRECTARWIANPVCAGIRPAYKSPRHPRPHSRRPAWVFQVSEIVPPITCPSGFTVSTPRPNAPANPVEASSSA